MPNNISDHVMSMDAYLDAHYCPSPKAKHPAPLLRAVGARTSKHTIALHEKYQGLAIPKPDFIFEERRGEGWGGRIVFVDLLGDGKDVEIVEQGTFGSKQEAKENLSEQALQLIAELERSGELEKKAKKESPVKVQKVEKEKTPGMNYVGQLLEFQRSTASPQPIYTDYQLGSTYACLATIEGHPDSFGSTGNLFTSKKAAHQDAARHAVEYFKSVDLWPDTFTDGGGIKKKKTKIAQSHSSFESSSSNPEGSGADGGSQGSHAQHVAHLAAQLSLPTPSWTYSTASASAPGFHTVFCSFKNSAPHEGPIGEVRNIFGKKKAKEECARLTVQYLLELKEERLRHGRMMMEGIIGGKDVQGIAIKRPIGGEREVEGLVLERRAERQFREEMGAESDDDLEELRRGDV